MFNDKAELNEVALEHGVHRCLMPDRFLLTSSSEQLWAMVLGGKHGIRALADKLKKHDGLTDYPREMRRKIGSESMIAMMLCSHESRAMLRNEGILDQNDWTGWVLAANTKALAGQKGKVAPSWKLDFRKYALDFSQKVVKQMVDLLAPYTNIDFYRGLGRVERDLADFVVNAALCNLHMEDGEFVHDFIEEYNWLMERQSGFVLGFNRAYKEDLQLVVKVDLRNPPENIPFAEFWRNCLKFLCESTPARGGNFSGHELVSSAQILLSMCENRKPGIVIAMRDQIQRDENDLMRAIRRLNQEVEMSGLMVKQASWIEALSSLETLTPLPEFPPLSKDLAAVVDKYTTDRSATSTLVSHDGAPFEESLRAIKSLKASISEEILKPASDVEVLGSLTADLKVHTGTFERISNSLGTLFAQIMKCSLGLRADIARIVEGTAPEVVPVTPAYPDLSQDLERVQTESEALQATLDNQVKATEAVQATVEKLSNEISLVKEENHLLKQRMAFTPHEPIDDEPELDIPVDLHAIITGVREPKPIETLLYFEQLAPDRVVILPSAKRSALEADNLQLGFQLAKLVDRLVFAYLDALNSGVPDAEARKIFGKSYKAKESDGVRQNRRLRSLREFSYNGETHLFERHIGIGRNYGTQHSIRLYFEVIEGKLVIAYCGEHLDSVQTN
jgi:hypothetical protein